jgi:hypothetical protein
MPRSAKKRRASVKINLISSREFNAAHIIWAEAILRDKVVRTPLLSSRQPPEPHRRQVAKTIIPYTTSVETSETSEIRPHAADCAQRNS